ncbi:MAG: Na+/H+ antiporter NhaC family protein [Clostridiales bacterium]|nr:Na+/H+ antiporter NhaC family protein [Clostridiales bacterium]
MQEQQRKGNWWALLPIAVFLVVYIGVSLIFNDFYVMSVVVAFLIAILVACFQNRKLNFENKLSVMANGLADKNIVTMILIFLAAGIFAGTLGRDGAKTVADLFLSFIPSNYSALVLFIVSCFVSTAMGTSCGTITVVAPIALALSQSTGVSLPLLVGSVIGGAMFGDNLSFISDTTIAATSTQGCKMKDKFKENFFIALPAALLTIVILLVFAFTSSGTNNYVPEKINVWLLIPYVLVLVGGIAGVNVFIVLLSGIATAIIIKLALGAQIISVITAMGGGASGMFEVIMVTVLVTMLSALMREFGGFDALLSGIKRVFKGKVGGQLGISLLVSAMDVATANNTVAIVMAAPIAKTISEDYGITNTKTASLLDIFGSVVQGIIPYGAQMVTAVSLTATSAGTIIPFLFYPYLLAISAIAFMVIPAFFTKKA